MIRECILGAAVTAILSSAAFAQSAPPGAASGVQPYRPAGASGSGLRTPNPATGTYSGQSASGCVSTTTTPCPEPPAKGNVVTHTLGGVPGLVGGTVGGALGNGASLIGGTVGGALGVDRKPKPEETPSRP
jgi:hypothetical protein